MELPGHDFAEGVGEDVVDALVPGEGPAVPGGLDPDDGVAHGEDAEEEHEEEEGEEEVVGAGGAEDDLVGDVAGEDGPGPEVHDDDELDDVDEREPRGEEDPHPDHPLVVDQVEDVLGDLEVPVLRELLLQVPAPTAVHEAHEQGPQEVDYHR